MKTTTKKNFTKEIKKHFKAISGLTIAEAKAKIKKQMIVDEYDNQVRAGNVKLLYTDNPNYCGGIKNGYGKGFYLSNIGFTGGSQIKL